MDDFRQKKNALSPVLRASNRAASGKGAYFALWFVLRALSVSVSIFIGAWLRSHLRGCISIVEGICAFCIDADEKSAPGTTKSCPWVADFGP